MKNSRHVTRMSASAVSIVYYHPPVKTDPSPQLFSSDRLCLCRVLKDRFYLRVRASDAKIVLQSNLDAGSSNGRTQHSGCCCSGSNPLPAVQTKCSRTGSILFYPKIPCVRAVTRLPPTPTYSTSSRTGYLARSKSD